MDLSSIHNQGDTIFAQPILTHHFKIILFKGVKMIKLQGSSLEIIIAITAQQFTSTSVKFLFSKQTVKMTPDTVTTG